MTDFKFSKTVHKSSDTVIALICSERKLPPILKEINKTSGGLIDESLSATKSFKGKNGETLLTSLPAKTGFRQLVLLGVGEAKSAPLLKGEEAGGKLLKALQAAKANHATLLADKGQEEYAAAIACGAKLRAYNFEKYKTKSKDKDGKEFARLDVVSENAPAIQKLFKAADPAIEGTFLARDLVNEPPNRLYPESYVETIKKELKPLGVEIDVLDEKKMQKLGMEAILAVGMGSARPPRMVIMRWNGTGKNGKSAAKSVPLALVGKGVTFDTGGISLKPGPGMDEMKMDMGGSAAVVGTMKTLALRGAKVDVIGAIGLAENMPSDRAYRPGDVIGSHSGKTIEVLNTDAEGRLVLCDVLSYVQDTYSPKTVIDLATLTGAMMVALAHEYCGTFVNNDDLWKSLETASAETGEKLWRMPLDEVWKKDMEGNFGDVQNLAKSNGRYGGACTAAGFLEHFIKPKVKWAHMDIAGTAWIKSDKPTTPKFGTGFGVRVLNTYIKNTYG